jgi:hypothetical protein
MIYESYFKPFIHIIYYYCTITVVYNKLFPPGGGECHSYKYFGHTRLHYIYWQVVCRWRKGFIVRKIIILPTRTTRNWLYFCTSEFRRCLSVSPANRKYCFNIILNIGIGIVWCIWCIQCARRAMAPRWQGRETLRNCSSRVVSTTSPCTGRVLWVRRV